LAWFAAIVPLTVSGFILEGDFVTVAFYLAGLLLVVHEKDGWVPLLVAVGSTNREQMGFFVAFHAAFLLGRGRLWAAPKLLALAGSLAAWGAVYLGLRAWLGWAPNPFTTALNVAQNLNPLLLEVATVPLWLAVVAGFVTLCVLAWRRSNLFFRAGLVLLV